MLRKVLSEISDINHKDASGDNGSSVSVKGECSFCGELIRSVRVSSLDDGRMMCHHCEKLIVSDEEKLDELFDAAVAYLASEFGAAISENIKVRFATADSIRLRMRTGEERVVLGFADPNSRELWVESDAPATNLSEVIVHELTHFWQFDNIKTEEVELEYIEGQASYVEVQYLRRLGQGDRADKTEAALERRDDPYGRGFRRLKQELADRGDSNSFSYMRTLGSIPT